VARHDAGQVKVETAPSRAPSTRQAGADETNGEMMMTDRELITTAVGNDREALIDGVRHIYNCRDVDVDDDGNVWISVPQIGHWLDDDGIARIARALKAGDI
jgi:hypothetical protein